MPQGLLVRRPWISSQWTQDDRSRVVKMIAVELDRLDKLSRKMKLDPSTKLTSLYSVSHRFFTLMKCERIVKRASPHLVERIRGKLSDLLE